MIDALFIFSASEIDLHLRVQTYPSCFQGQICENLECGIKMHYHCVARYFKGRTDPHCPSCSDFWAHEIPGKIRYYTVGLNLLHLHRSSHIKQKQTLRKCMCCFTLSEIQPESQSQSSARELPAPAPAPSTSATRRSRRS